MSGWSRLLLTVGWLFAVVLGVFLVLAGAPLAGAADLLMFGVGAGGPLVVPFLTKKHGGAATLGTVRLGGTPERALLFRYARGKQLLYAVSAAGFGSGLALIFVYDAARSPWPSGFQPGLAVAVAVIAACYGSSLLLVWYAVPGKHALALTPESVAQVTPWGWAAAPWSAIRSVAAFELHLHGGAIPYLGIALTDRAALRRSPHRLPRVLRLPLVGLDRLGNVLVGYDLTFPCTTLATSHRFVERTCQHFLAHPEHRRLLGTKESIRMTEPLALSAG